MMMMMMIGTTIKEATGWIQSWGRNRSFTGLNSWSEEEEEEEEDDDDDDDDDNEVQINFE
jgi:hypothetical protein